MRHVGSPVHIHIPRGKSNDSPQNVSGQEACMSATPVSIHIHIQIQVPRFVANGRAAAKTWCSRAHKLRHLSGELVPFPGASS